MILVSRRAALLGLTAAVTMGPCSLALAQAATNKRFVVVILRGGLDGLAAVVPHGDPNLAVWRPDLLAPRNGGDALLDLGGFFGLHPLLTGLHTMFAAGDCLPVHAVAGGYRTRSHFDAQDFLECGAEQRVQSGWLNRAVGCLPQRQSEAGDALAIGVTIPLVLRGPAMVGNYAPEGGEKPPPELYARILALNEGDRLTGPAIAEGLRGRSFSAAALNEGPSLAGDPRGGFPALAAAAGRFLAAPDGPRVAALELGGWDTHAEQLGRLRGPLKQLDDGLVALKQNLGEAWPHTAILVMTEFGRTVRMNGTKGTDHGTAGVAFVLGGCVAGGRVAGSWPGLSERALFENRDLAPTTDMREVAKGILAAHLGLDAKALEAVFPGSARVQPMNGLIRT
jgi:uncharacterized protein (DUF1501 family)